MQRARYFERKHERFHPPIISVLKDDLLCAMFHQTSANDIKYVVNAHSAAIIFEVYHDNAIICDLQRRENAISISETNMYDWFPLRSNKHICRCIAIRFVDSIKAKDIL